MKKRYILFFIFSMMCLSLVAGCGETKYKISAKMASNECGYVTGGGEYTIGSTVTLTVHENLYCEFEALGFKKSGSEEILKVNNTSYEYKLVAGGNGYSDVGSVTFTVSSANIGEYIFYFNDSYNEIPNKWTDMSEEENTGTGNTGGSSGSGSGNTGTGGSTGSGSGNTGTGGSTGSGSGNTGTGGSGTGESGNSGGNANTQNTFTVRYGLYDSSGGPITDSNVFVTSETVTSGKYPVNAVNYINSSDERLKNMKVTWYTSRSGNSFSNPYTGAAITSNIWLYGLVQELSAEAVVKEMIDSLRTSKGVEIVATNSSDTNYKEQAVVKGLNKYYPNETLSELDIVVKSNMNNGSSYEMKQNLVLDNGRYYEYRYEGGKTKIVGFDLGSSTFELDDISDLYKFIELADLDASSYDPISNPVTKVSTGVSYTLSDLTYAYGSSKGSNVVITEKYTFKNASNEEISVYVYSGKVYKMEKGNVTLEIRYKDELVVESVGTSDTMYFLRLDSNDSTLSTKFRSMNNDFSKILKIVPAYGETVISVLDTVEELKEYSYKVLKGVGQAEYNSSVVDDNLNLWIEVGTSLETVSKSINEFLNGGFVINTSFNIEGFDIGSRSYLVASGEDMLDSSIVDNNDVNKMHSNVQNAIKAMKKIINPSYTGDRGYSRFESEEANDIYTFKFYRGKYDSEPYLTIVGETYTDLMSGNEFVRIKSFSYYTNGNTYINSLDYDDEKIALIGAIISLYDGAYVLNGTAIIEPYSEDYNFNFDEEKPADVEEVVWNYFKLLSKIKADFQSLTFDSETSTFTKGEETYTFTLRDGEITKIVYSNGGDVVTYTVDSASWIILEIMIPGFLNTSNNSRYIKDASGTYLISENLTKEGELTKPSSMSQEAWNVLLALRQSSTSFDSCSYTTDNGFNLVIDSKTYIVKFGSETMYNIMPDIVSIEHDGVIYEIVNDYYESNSTLQSIIDYYNEYENVTVKIGDSYTVTFKKEGETTLEDLLTDTNNACVRLMNKLIDIRDNMDKYSVSLENDVDGTIESKTIKDESSNIVFIFDDIFSNGKYYENGTFVGNISYYAVGESIS